MTKAPKLLLALAACTMLAGCASSGTTAQGTSGGPDLATNPSQVGAAMQRVAQDLNNDEKTPDIAMAERQYNRKPSDPGNAMKYAAALRQGGYANRGQVVLAPFADSPKPAPGVETEYSAIQLALGNNETAERYAQKAVLQNPQDAKAYHYLGIALDAQGKHPEAERAFRKGLDLWQGDPTPIMNNLALNLSAQGFLDEAVDILEKAKAIAPDRVEIERNLRIVTALRQSGIPTTPKPGRKPAPPAGIVEPSGGDNSPVKKIEVQEEKIPPAVKAAPAARAPVKPVAKTAPQSNAAAATPSRAPKLND